MQKLILCLSLLTVVTTTSCKKEKDEMDPLTKESLVGNYKLMQVTMQLGSNERDVTEFFAEDCELDDIIQFKTDLTFEVTDNGVQCNPPTEESGPWDIIDDHTISIDEESATVTKWDGKDLYFTRPDVVEGKDVTVLFKLRKQ